MGYTLHTTPVLYKYIIPDVSNLFYVKGFKTCVGLTNK